MIPYGNVHMLFYLSGCTVLFEDIYSYNLPTRSGKRVFSSCDSLVGFSTEFPTGINEVHLNFNLNLDVGSKKGVRTGARKDCKRKIIRVKD